MTFTLMNLLSTDNDGRGVGDVVKRTQSSLEVSFASKTSDIELVITVEIQIYACRLTLYSHKTVAKNFLFLHIDGVSFLVCISKRQLMTFYNISLFSLKIVELNVMVILLFSKQYIQNYSILQNLTFAFYIHILYEEK